MLSVDVQGDEEEEEDDVQGCQGCDHFVHSGEQQYMHVEECLKVFWSLIESNLGENSGQA